MSVEDKLREIRTSISQVQGKKARAQVEFEAATERRELARRTLKEEFQVETNDDARAKLAQLQGELDDSVAAVVKALEEAGA